MKLHDIIDEINEISREIGEVETEFRVIEHCARRGLNYDDASDFSRAVLELSKEDAQAVAALRNKNRRSKVLLSRNSIVTSSPSEYNRVIRTQLAQCRARLEDISEYGWATKLWSWIKSNPTTRKPAELFAGRIVYNNTPVRIKVGGGNKENGEHEFTYVYPGNSSKGSFYDADVVVIIPGQKYFKSVNRKTVNNIVTSGVFKFSDNPIAKRVSVEFKRIGSDLVLYVADSGAQYFTSLKAAQF